LYEKGEGVVKDASEAARWYRRAAEQGLLQAQLYLGGLYTTGNGVPMNPLLAYQWLSLAKVGGVEIPDGVLESDLQALEATLDASEVAEAQAGVRERMA
jgi:hypothetical protein